MTLFAGTEVPFNAVMRNVAEAEQDRLHAAYGLRAVVLFVRLFLSDNYFFSNRGS